MSSVCELTLRRDIPMNILYSKLKSHVIIYNPPYNISAILMSWSDCNGQPIRVEIDHSSRDVNIITPGINRLILRTAITTFQNHHLQRSIPAHSSLAAQGPRKTCSICMDEIYALEIIALRCAHTFHRQCIARWSLEKRNCPECRCPLT